MEDTPRATNDQLTAARETIAQQAEEIRLLRNALASSPYCSELGEAVTQAAAAGAVSPPVEHGQLLEIIVETAMQVIDADAGSLLLVDEAGQELIFEVARGGRPIEVKKLRVPIGHGIAGLVALTGQPMAVTHASLDPRHAVDIAERVGYTPDSILAVPLHYDDQIIGVLELLDKMGSDSFTPKDMEALGLFANQAAIAIQQSRAYFNITSLVLEILEDIAAAHHPERARDPEQAARFVRMLDEDPTYQRSFELAQLVGEIARQGERETSMCMGILRACAGYLRSQPAWNPPSVLRR